MARGLARRFATGLVVAAVLVAGWIATRPVLWVSTLGGGGMPGYADGPVAGARFYMPTGLAMDARDPARPKLYVADTYNHRVRMVDLQAPEGAVVSTIAGCGGLGFSSGSSRDGPGDRATFHFPRDLALDGRGGLYVLDTNGHRIRRVGLEEPGRPVTTIAGGPAGFKDGPGATARFQAPWGLAFDGTSLIVADTYNHRIRRIDLGDARNMVTTIAGGPRGYADGIGQAAAFESPVEVAVDPGAQPPRIYVADASNRCVRVIEEGPAGARVETVGGAPFQASWDTWLVDVPLMYPAGLAVGPGGTLYVADQSAAAIYRVTAAGRLTTMAGDPGGPPGRRDGLIMWARFGQPSGLEVGPDGTIYVADATSHTLRVMK